MSLPIALGAKTVSSRPLVAPENNGDDGEGEHEYFAEDEITPLVPVRVSGIPRTAMAVCPKQEWLAMVTIQYNDMIMAVDEGEDDEEEEEAGQEKEARHRHLARHSTIAEIRIQISPLSLPFSSAYRDVLHRVELPNLPTNSPKRSGHRPHHHYHHGHKPRYLDDEYLEFHGEHAPIQPCIVFSSDRRNLACLIPYPRGSQSILYSFPLQRPTPRHAPRPRPPVPYYIPTSSNANAINPSRRTFVPEASSEPQWLCLPSHAALDIRQNALYWLHNITSLCDSSTQTKRITAKGSSVLLAGCRDGSILGISFNPLLLVGLLYHPSPGGFDGPVSFLTHMTISKTSSNESTTSSEGGVLGRLVAVRESGKAQIFQTRMVLSSLTDEQDLNQNYLDESVSALDDMDATDYSASDYAAGATGVVMIHGESFHVVKTGRRNSLPASADLSLDEQDHNDLQHFHVHRSGSLWAHKQIENAPMGTKGLLMLLEPLSEFSGNVSRAHWITGSLLALLEKPTMNKQTQVQKDTTSNKNLVAQVVGVFSDRPPEPISELQLSHEDLHENAHTTFSLEEFEQSSKQNSLNSNTRHNNPLPLSEVSLLLEASLGIHYDPASGCLAISSARLSKPIKQKQDQENSNDPITGRKVEAKIFVCLWQWRQNVIGFTAVALKSLGTTQHHYRPLSRLFLATDKLSKVRRMSHLHCTGGAEFDRLRKDLYDVGVLSPPQNLQKENGWCVKDASPVLLSSSAVTFALVTEPFSDASEVEWQESAIPINYTLDYGAPEIAVMSTTGRSIAVASSRGLCVLECSPRSKKMEQKGRTYLLPEFVPSDPHEESSVRRQPIKKFGAGYRSPPKWHVFGNELEERSFRVLAMAWWDGMDTYDGDRYICDDLLIAVIQLQNDNSFQDGACYLASWSQRRLDLAHQRLRPLEIDLDMVNRQWGVRLPNDFHPTTLKLVAQPSRKGVVTCDKLPARSRRERKAVALLTSTQDSSGSVRYLTYQMQTVPSVKTKKADSYHEQEPYSVLSRLCSKGEFSGVQEGSFISSVFLASASFQFDLLSSTSPNLSVNGENKSKSNEIVGTVGVVRSPGSGLEAVAITSSGPSKSVYMFSFHDYGNAMLHLENTLKSTEVSSYWLADVVNGTRPISTNFGEKALIDLFVWAIQLADGTLLSWFVPCLEFHPFPSDTEISIENECPNLFSSRIMLGAICSIGDSATWMYPSPAGSGRDMVVGYLPHSPCGCILSTGQASRKFHRSIAGDFDHTLFAPDFMEHEFLYPNDVSLSPPAFMSSIASLIYSRASLRLNITNANVEHMHSTRCLANAGGDDMESSIKAIDTSDHLRALSQAHQDAAFTALRLLVLRFVEQVAEDRKTKENNGDQVNPMSLSASALSDILPMIRKCTSSRLQFASLLLEVGRQLEPSCFSHLFPLPVSGNKAGPSTKMKSIDKINLHSVLDLFNACVDDGSVSTSVSSLPIIQKDYLSREKSIFILDHCLGLLIKNTCSEDNLFFDFCAEERSTLSDVFRFGVKLEDSGTGRFLEKEYESDSNTSGSTSDSSDSEEGNDGQSRRKSYGITCGIFNMFATTSDPATSKLNSRKGRNIHNGDSYQSPSDVSDFESFAGAVASVLVELVFPVDCSSVESHSWKRLAAIASLLLGPNKTLLPRCSAKEFTESAKTMSKDAFQENGNNTDSVEDRIATLLTRTIVACRSDITVPAAGRILDLSLVLLSRCRTSSELGSIVPGLLIIGVTAAHISGRINEILLTKNVSVPFTKSYWTARERANNMGSF